MIDRLPAAEFTNSDIMLEALVRTVDGMAQVFVCDNVTKYFFEETDKEYWEPADFPLFVPPYPVMWMESRRPEKIVSEVHGVTKPQFMPKTWGGLFITADDPNLVLSSIEYFAEVPPTPGKTKKLKDYTALRGRAKRATVGYIYQEPEQYFVAGGGMCVIWTDEDGSIIDWDFTVRFPDEETAYRALAMLEATGAGTFGLDNLVYPLLLAVSFSNCKNVEVIRKHPDAKFNRVHQKRGGRPLKSYSVVQIHPVTKVAAERQPGGAKTGIVRALHICRGHFAHYGGDKGKLFGKLEGTFWISPHKRGSGEAVKQRYKVNPK